MRKVYVFPCSLKYFDIQKYFEKETDTIWRKIGSVSKDDIVYIYISAPISEIRYCCTVIDDEMEYQSAKESGIVILNGKKKELSKYIRIRLTEDIKTNSYDFQTLKDKGLKQFMVPMLATPELSEYLTQNFQKK